MPSKVFWIYDELTVAAMSTFTKLNGFNFLVGRTVESTRIATR